MAEGARFERTCDCSQPRFSGPVRSLIPSTFRGARGSSRTSTDPLLRRTPLPLGYTRVVVREVGLEPTKSPRSERGAFANLTTPAMVETDGFEPPKPRRATRLQRAAFGRSATSPRTGAAPEIRTRTLQALDLTPLPIGLEPHGAPGRIRTDKTHKV